MPKIPNKYDRLEQDLQKASQLPVHTTRASYNAALQHGKTEGKRWACSKSGAPFHVFMTPRSVWDRETGLRCDYVSVMHIYCSSCEKPPQVKKGDPIFKDELITVAM